MRCVLLLQTCDHITLCCLLELSMPLSYNVAYLQEFFSDRNDASLFAFGSHSKKRPHNLVLGQHVRTHTHTHTHTSTTKIPPCACSAPLHCSLGTTAGRMFDYRVLDMFELGIQKFLPMSYFKVSSHVT